MAIKRSPRPLSFPVRGAANHSTFTRQPAAFAPRELLRNARLFSPLGDRPCFGSRPGHVKHFPQSLNGKAVQAMRSVSRAKVILGHFIPNPDPVAGYVPCELVTTGTSRETAALVGNVWGLDSVPAMTFERFEDVSDDGGGPFAAVNAIAVSPEGTHYAHVVNYTDGSLGKAIRLRYVLKNNTSVWSLTINGALIGASPNLGANAVAIGKIYVFVAEGMFVHVVRRDTGAYVTSFACNLWAQEVIDIVPWTDPATSIEYLFIAFDGANPPKTLASGALVSAGKWARHFRSGIMKCLVKAAYNTPGAPLTQVPYGPTLPSNDRYFEANHQYCRISEQGNLRPAGAMCQGLTVFSDGAVALATANAGWGPDSNPASQDYRAPDLTTYPPINVRMYDKNGLLVWEQDTESWFEVGDGGFFNDLSITGGSGVTNLPTLQAIAVNKQNIVFVAGRRTSPGYSAYALRGSDGSVLWRAALMGASHVHREGALCIDPSTDNPVFGGDQNNTAGNDAHLWMRKASDGAAVWDWKLTGTVSSNGVAAWPDGELVYGTDKV